VERVFPVYFGIGLVVSLTTLLLGFKYGRLIAVLALFNLLLHAILIFYVLPTAHSLKLTDYDAFMRWHGIRN